MNMTNGTLWVPAQLGFCTDATLMQRKMTQSDWLMHGVFVVQWLGYMTLTYESRVQFPAWEVVSFFRNTWYNCLQIVTILHCT